MALPTDLLFALSLVACSHKACAVQDSGPPTPNDSFGTPDAGSVPVLTGNVYFIPTTTTVFPDVPMMPSQGTIFAAELNVAPQSWMHGVVGDRDEWFAIRYTGLLTAGVAGDYKFRVLSDDGANLYID